MTDLFLRLNAYLETVNPCNPYGTYLSQDAKEALRYALESLQLGEMTADEFITAIDEIY